MPALYRDTGYSLTHLVEDIKHGNIALPDIQRPFMWKAAQVRDLFDSLYRGYPVGTLLFWETGAEVGTRQIGSLDNERGNVAKLLIIDGQQRLTSLYAVITGQEVLTKKFTKEHIRIAFHPREEAFEVTDAAIQRDPEFIPDITALWNKGYRPTVRSYLTRLTESRGEELSEGEEDELEDRIDRVYDLKNFRFQVIELNTNVNEEQIADIFVRTNSEGVHLSHADFLLTLMSVHWEKGRQELETFCWDAIRPEVQDPSPRNGFIDPSPDQLLRVDIGLAFGRGRAIHVYNILRGKDPESGRVSPELREEQFNRLRSAQDEVLDLTNWHKYLKCLRHAGFRNRNMINSEITLIYCYILWLIGRRDFELGSRTLRSVIARWFFMAQTTGRYTTSSETVLESDLARIRSLPKGDGSAFCEEFDRLVLTNFTSDYWDISLPNRLDTSGPNSAALYAYWAALNILKAELLFSDIRLRDLLSSDPDADNTVEYHHLFPQAYLATLGITDRHLVNNIANMTFLNLPKNRDISNAVPGDYWQEFTAGMNPDQRKRQEHWHALPPGWWQLDYPDFLEKRRALMAQVVKEGFKQLWDNAPADIHFTTLEDMLQVGESQTQEFKSSARWNLRKQQPDKKMQHAITKTVCGFLNSGGGKLFIGVNDHGNVVGIENDIRSLGKKNQDGYEQFLRQHLDATLSRTVAGLVDVEFKSERGYKVCVITVGIAGKPFFAKPLEGGIPSEFWVRDGNATKQLHGEDMEDYQDRHWS